MAVPGIFPPGAPILIIGQAPGDKEVLYGRPFIGPAGKELATWLRIADIPTTYCAITNVFNEQLPVGGLPDITKTTREATANGWINKLPAIAKGRYLIPEWHYHLTRLMEEVTCIQPKLIIALGDQALWASAGTIGITAKRGTLYTSVWGPPAIATYHPSAIIRGGWKYRPTAIADMMKAKRIVDGGQTIPQRVLELQPTAADLGPWLERLILAPVISIDIETNASLRQITSIAFADSATWACCVPFVNDRGKSYWNSVEDEVVAWEFVHAVCTLPAAKIFQNGMYDVQWLWVIQHIPVRNYIEDTRLIHHALYPELPKSLSFMASIWENEFSWKTMRNTITNKGDD